MRHLASRGFWEAYHKLPEQVRALADKNYALLKENPQHPSLQLKKVGRFWSVRVGLPLQLPFCFEVSALGRRLVSSAPE